LEALERAIFTGQDGGRVFDVRGHEVVEAILDVRETLLNVGQRDDDLAYLLVGVFPGLRDENPRRVALRLWTRFAGRAGGREGSTRPLSSRKNAAINDMQVTMTGKGCG
jgi:hypothetical protein